MTETFLILKQIKSFLDETHSGLECVSFVLLTFRSSKVHTIPKIRSAIIIHSFIHYCYVYLQIITLPPIPFIRQISSPWNSLTKKATQSKTNKSHDGKHIAWKGGRNSRPTSPCYGQSQECTIFRKYSPPHKSKIILFLYTNLTF